MNAIYSVFFFLSGEPFLPKMQVAFLLCFFLLFYNLNKKEGGRLLIQQVLHLLRKVSFFSFLAFFPVVSGDKVLR